MRADNEGGCTRRAGTYEVSIKTRRGRLSVGARPPRRLRLGRLPPDVSQVVGRQLGAVARWPGAARRFRKELLLCASRRDPPSWSPRLVCPEAIDPAPDGSHRAEAGEPLADPRPSGILNRRPLARADAKTRPDSLQAANRAMKDRPGGFTCKQVVEQVKPGPSATGFSDRKTSHAGRSGTPSSSSTTGHAEGGPIGPATRRRSLIFSTLRASRRSPMRDNRPPSGGGDSDIVSN